MPTETIAPALSYWESIRSGRALPRRCDIDPTQIPRLLPYIMLVDVLAEPLDFRFRLVGTVIDAITSRSLRGQRFSENARLAHGSNIWNDYTTVSETRQPLTGRVDYIGSDRFVRDVRHCLMPLSETGGTVTMIFVAVEVVRVS